VMAARRTSLADEVEGAGIVTQPGDLDAFIAAIERLLSDQPLRERLAIAARQRAEIRWRRSAMIDKFEARALRR
jgi:colanic acid biosynthesis glycosyl transferase WcaI